MSAPGSVAADGRSGRAAGLRSPELASETSASPVSIGWWWWLLVALVVGAAAGAWFWARRRRLPSAGAGTPPPAGPGPGLEAGADPTDDDDWLEGAFVDDVPSISG